MSETTLKSCPFCGGEAEVHQNEIDKRWYISCMKPHKRRRHAVLLSSTYKKNAIKAWNRRTP